METTTPSNPILWQKKRDEYIMNLERCSNEEQFLQYCLEVFNELHPWVHRLIKEGKIKVEQHKL